uniref:Murine leukemia virus integrase C-terminal domain-containing protein n=1 Tax=Buteo japonicus TaxID=224669 RepID=A0A8C0B871_9AVES
NSYPEPFASKIVRYWVYVKSWTSEPLAEKWKGLYQVILTTYTAVKAWGKRPWLHYSRIKKAPTGNWNSIEELGIILKIEHGVWNLLELQGPC